MMRFISMNTGRAGLHKSNTILDFLSVFPAEFIGLQEVDVGHDSCAAFDRFWQSHGYFSVLADTSSGMARAALLCTTPLKALHFDVSQPARVAGAVLELSHDDQVQRAGGA